MRQLLSLVLRSGTPVSSLVASLQTRRALARFQRYLQRTKAALPELGFAWYPYSTFSSLQVILDLVGGVPALQQLIGQERVADIGCADGDLAFFLSSLGVVVDAVDHPPTNFNHMQGVHALQAALQASVTIYEADLDSQFLLPQPRYGVCFFLGILYHLKNPYYALEKLAHTSQYCFLSTRIARFTPDHRTLLQDVPVAYLLDSHEANNDATNYWIFSPAGLRRLLDRTGWIVRAYRHTGHTVTSDPVHADERVFYFLESKLYTRSGSESD